MRKGRSASFQGQVQRTGTSVVPWSTQVLPVSYVRLAGGTHQCVQEAPLEGISHDSSHRAHHHSNIVGDYKYLFSADPRKAGKKSFRDDDTCASGYALFLVCCFRLNCEEARLHSWHVRNTGSCISSYEFLVEPDTF